jgi:hypothetical protein
VVEGWVVAIEVEFATCHTFHDNLIKQSQELQYKLQEMIEENIVPQAQAALLEAAAASLEDPRLQSKEATDQDILPFSQIMDRNGYNAKFLLPECIDSIRA